LTKNFTILNHPKICLDIGEHLNPGTKPFVNLRNKTRNELKHHVSGDPIDVDLEDKAGRLIAHAIENYVNLAGHETSTMRRFQEKRLHLPPPHDPSFDATITIP
jgi:hypothetical protein